MKVKLLMVLMIAITSCASKAPSYFDKDALANEIQQRFNAFVTGMNKLDGEALLDFYSNDERFYWVEDGKIQYANKEALAASLNGLVGMLSSSNMNVLKTRVEVTSETTALCYAEYEQAMVMSSGGGFDINGAMTILMQKEAGVWRFLIGHSSTKKERG
ncbi:hypothetical protein BFP97_01025 [Roseivirga sp. 4D4]|uniref:nuclear transport factor 2 family protein n=1 Tax=Roseivirga sp. 4D4 TaxID=1889784 RepID=UPI000852A96E|nr:nuclear transport factor 2 family protein [Roseivirga sp. 4D4]OEK00181.1 hypothetical protein BFP97_01025 [Roseivirga sp. 4D4]